jgi:PAS domain S-box-containing protein
MSAELSKRCPHNNEHTEIANEAFWVFFDGNRRWLKCSQEVADFFGYTRSELEGTTADKLFPKDFVYNVDGWEQFLAEGQITRFIPLTKKSGKIVGVWIEYKKLNDGCMVAILKL